MTIEDKIIQAIYAAIDEVNPQLEDEKRIRTKSLATPLFGGESGMLDSLSLVTLCVSIEEKIEDKFQIPIMITDERALSQKRSPFLTIKTLSDYLQLLLSESHFDQS